MQRFVAPLLTAVPQVRQQDELRLVAGQADLVAQQLDSLWRRQSHVGRDGGNQLGHRLVRDGDDVLEADAPGHHLVQKPGSLAGRRHVLPLQPVHVRIEKVDVAGSQVPDGGQVHAGANRVAGGVGLTAGEGEDTRSVECAEQAVKLDLLFVEDVRQHRLPP